MAVRPTQAGAALPVSIVSSENAALNGGNIRDIVVENRTLTGKALESLEAMEQAIISP